LQYRKSFSLGYFILIKYYLPMEKIRSNCAGIDIGSENVFTSIGQGDVVKHLTFTEDFHLLRKYLLDNKIQSVAMEATGVYWVVLYDILEEAGLDVWLVDGRQTKQVPGRKTDVKDCQWIQQLHCHGLLSRSHVAVGDIKELREYQRIREDHIRSSSMHINHMQKALTQMNIRLTEVISQIQGKSGMAIIDAILAGNRNKRYLLDLCHGPIKKEKSKQILKALEGRYTDMGIFSLGQARKSYQYYQTLILECDAQIEKVLKRINKDKTLPPKEEVKKRKYAKGNHPKIEDLGRHLMSIFRGKDATDIPGISDYIWLQLYGEIGDDLRKWKTEKHFTSWLGLAPGQHNSGKRRQRSRKRGKPKAGQIFRVIAQGLIQSRKIAIGAFGRKLRSRKGPAIAIKAMARKLAVQYWRLIVKGKTYVEYGIKHYEEQVAQQKLRALMKLAKKMNATVTFPVNSG